MATALTEMLARNSKLAESYQAPPSLTVIAEASKAGNGVIVLSCSDPRLHPEMIFGIDASIKATMIRNAGGRAFDAIRTVSVLQAIGGAKMVVVIHHTDCGLTHLTDEDVRNHLLKIAPDQKDIIEESKYGEIKESVEQSIEQDVAFLAASPFVTPGTMIVGLKFDISTGIANEVERKVNRGQ
ncbi:carbonic anhydrase [Xylariales sp. PMI_506]|nr:carbonic anhydrase [Xylariales sp. PMI_506]